MRRTTWKRKGKKKKDFQTKWMLNRNKKSKSVKSQTKWIYFPKFFLFLFLRNAFVLETKRTTDQHVNHKFNVQSAFFSSAIKIISSQTMNDNEQNLFLRQSKSILIKSWQFFSLVMFEVSHNQFPLGFRHLFRYLSFSSRNENHIEREFQCLFLFCRQNEQMKRSKCQ